MSDNEIKREQPSFEVRAESLKERTKNFFSTYENPNGSEDRLEICLIREGYRTVLKAEEKINSLQKDKEYYKKSRDECQDKIIFISKQCDKLQEENQQLKSEIKRLTDEKMSEEKVFSVDFDIHSIKAEAVKEFAVRLKGLSFQTYKGYFAYEITAENLNNLVKEMAGEK